MDAGYQVVVRKSPSGIRPKLLAISAVIVTLLFLPDVVARSYVLKLAFLLLATLSILAGWVLLATEGVSGVTWRSVMTTIAGVYLLFSLPVFLGEISQIRWLVYHPWHRWLSMYVRPWVHWGYTLVLLGIILSFLGRGRARIAFVKGSLLLLVLRVATGIWVF